MHCTCLLLTQSGHFSRPQTDILSRGEALSQFRERGLHTREYRGLAELRKDALCLGQMLERECTLFLSLVEQAENHFASTNMVAARVELGVLTDAPYEGTNTVLSGEHDRG